MINPKFQTKGVCGEYVVMFGNSKQIHRMANNYFSEQDKKSNKNRTEVSSGLQYCEIDNVQ